ncbi:MAG: mechanosensitive ion channel family protein [Brumimicrobium sp.]|nr:mechanosensitive ion channel family protein [Brumimicrobium sp.]
MENITAFYESMTDYFSKNYVSLGLSLLFLILGFILANFLKRKLRARLVKRSPNPITATFISQIVSFVIKLIIILITLNMIGLSTFTTKVLAGAGVLTFIIGFAFKDIGENFLAGIILAFKSPFKLDDLIETGNISGYVKDISIRETIIKTPDGKDVFLPNSIILKEPLFNYTIDGFLRYDFVVGIDYDDDVLLAIRLIYEALNDTPGVLQENKKPSVVIDDLGTNTLNLKVLFWINTFASTSRTVHSNVRTAVISNTLKKLSENGFYSPANIVEVKRYRKVES